MKIAIDIVSQELKFHKKNTGMTDKGSVYEQAFIDGIAHIHNLLISADKVKESKDDRAIDTRKHRNLKRNLKALNINTNKSIAKLKGYC